MSDAAHEARLVLCEWAGEVRDPDPEQREWKVAYAEGMLEAVKRTGLLPESEVAVWTQVFDSGIESLAAPAGCERATEAHLEQLLSNVTPMRRDSGPGEHEGRQRLHHALEALHDTGVIDDAMHEQWRRRALAAQAPWLDPEEIERVVGARGSMVAIAIPPETPEQAERDELERERMQRRIARGSVRTVIPAASIARADGLAVAAVVLRSESIEVLFHYVDPRADDQPEKNGHPDRFRAALEALAPPALTDDAGTRYEPVIDRPAQSQGTGGGPGSERPMVINGSWRYLPAAPQAASRFQVTHGASTQVFPND